MVALLSSPKGVTLALDVWGRPAAGPDTVSKNGNGKGKVPKGSGSAKLVLPIDFIGPDVDSIGGVPISEGGDYTNLGPKVEPVGLMPPDVPLSEEQRGRLALYLEKELDLCEREREPFISMLARLKTKYRPEYPDKPKMWPIANASQITIPVIMTSVDTIASRLYQTVIAADPPVMVKTEDEDFADFAFDYMEFLQLYANEIIDLEEVVDTWLSEMVTLGTSVLEVNNWRDQKAVGRYDVAAGKFIKESVSCHNGPIFFHVPIEDFWIRPGYSSPQKAPWCGTELRPTWTQIKDMAFSGMLNPEYIGQIARYEGAHTDTPLTVRIEDKLDKFEPVSKSVYRLHRLCVRWDVDGDGVEEELMVYFHRPSRTILRVIFNPYYRGRRPWEIGRYRRVPHRFYATGVAEMLEHLQDEISTIHNQRLDNATIANLRIILVSKLIQGLKPGDRLWSGKIVKVTNVKEDVGTLQLGEVYPSTVQNESIAQNYVREVSGVSETAMGQAQPVSRTTATAQMALLEELNRRFDKPLRNARKALGGAFKQLNDLFIEQGTGGLAEQWLGPVRGRRVEMFLNLPPELINKKLKMQITATRAGNNKEVEFQTQVAVMQLVNQMGEQMLRLTQGLAPHATGLIAHELVATIKPIFRKVMAYAEAGDPDKAISVLNVLERILPAPEDMGGMGAARQEEMAAMAAGRGAGGTGGGPNAGGSPDEVAALARLAASGQGSRQANRGQPVQPSTAGTY